MSRIKVYVASSWRNPFQPQVVARLREAGYEVYDFKDPAGSKGFAWSDIDPEWQKWDLVRYLKALAHPLAQSGFRSDMGALAECAAVVAVLPCGRSAHLELGYAVGAGKFTVALVLGENEPELMYRMLDCIADFPSGAIAALDRRFGRQPPPPSEWVHPLCGHCRGTGRVHRIDGENTCCPSCQGTGRAS
ncbi:MAG TPA: hypothetical protein VHD61_15600 [Lacunisphaera sp.]|nr:hypothetical protein [Lacunisphaera sp.]